MTPTTFRINEIGVMIYRLLLAYIFYFVVRLLFYFFNSDLLNIDSIGQLLSLSFYALPYDSASILYMSILFIFLSIIPVFVNTNTKYQKVLAFAYFIPNLLAYATNFIDLIYYKFILSRTTIAVIDSLEHEDNKDQLFINFLSNYWHVLLLYIICVTLWIYLYNKVKLKPVKVEFKKLYLLSSTILLVLSSVSVVAGIRGGITKKTRPINIVDANRYTTKPEHGDLVLNTPFSILRTLGKTSYKLVNYMNEETVEKYISGVKQYNVNSPSRPNIVLLITESFAKEYIGAFNKDTKIPNYKSYTPFIDSLAAHSLIYTNAFANGYKSIHSVPAILAGVPSFKEAFTSSPYPNQRIESLVSALNSRGYDTSFFHGAVNGSMGFQGFGNILGYDHYYGMTEYDNDDDFDGTWGIWDEPFFQFMRKTLNEKKEPFFATMFSVSSHEPFKIPEQYEGKFPKGDLEIHAPIGYTDYALKRFFEESKNEAWFKNTIFIITADHTNQKYYEEYKDMINRTAIPIMIYTADGRFKGEDNRLAQQLDIYPTILDIIGYDKPFRSWGSSLINGRAEDRFTISFDANEFTFQAEDYIVRFNGKEVTGFYDVNDKGLEKNLMLKKNKEMLLIEMKCKAFLQDYYERVVNRRLGVH